MGILKDSIVSEIDLVRS